MSAALWSTPYGNFELHRYPARSGERLQAWCGADKLLLEESFQRGMDGTDTLVVNDSHGALSLPLQPRALWTDSMLTAHALRANESRNDTAPTAIIWSTQSPPASSQVLLRIPKQLAYFEYQLSALAERMPPQSILLAAGMDKHLSPHTAQIIERYIGPTEHYPGQKKARLFSAVRNPATRAATLQPWTGYHCEELGQELLALPNVFSRERLDIGTRFLLQHLQHLQPVSTVVDLACGNGVMGLNMFHKGLAQRVIFCDESAQAVASARENAGRLYQARCFKFVHADGLEGIEQENCELIVCNPPFHLEHAVDDFAGKRLIAQCSEHLRGPGALLVVANRQLDYVPALRRGFTTVEQIAQNRKFRLLLARNN